MNEVSSLIESVQSNKIIQKIEKKKKTGEIRGEEEYKNELKFQLMNIRNLGAKSYFNFIGIPYSRAYSEYLNTAFEEILLDLEVAFFEASNLYAKILAHDTFFAKTIDEIERLIKRARVEIEQAEIETGSSNAYSKVITNNFSNNSDRVLPQNKYYNQLYFDKRSGSKVGKVDDAEIKTDENLLCLPRYVSSDVSISSVNIIETETTSSDYDFQKVNSDINEVLSDSVGSTWFYNIASEKRLERASLALEIDMGDRKEVNSFSFVPSSITSMEIQSISYVNENGDTVDLIPDSIVSSEKISLHFPKIITSRLKIILNQYSNQIIRYDKNSSAFSLEDLQRDKDISPEESMLADILKIEISDPTVKNIISGSSNKRRDIRTIYNYMFGISSISCSNSEYKPYGLYVSKQIPLRNLSLLSLQDDAEIDTFTSKDTGLAMPSGSIEYYLYKVDYDGTGRLMSTKEISVLPLNKEQVEGERLFFSASARILPLRFIAHTSAGDGSHVKLYRNGEELIRGIDWRFAERIDVLDDSDHRILPGKEETKIEILHSSVMLRHGIYYADYQPRFKLEENRKTLDKGTMYLPSGALSFPLDIMGTRIEKSHVFMKAIMRSNKREVTSSPRLHSYKLLVKEENNE